MRRLEKPDGRFCDMMGKQVGVAVMRDVCHEVLSPE